MTSCAVVMFPSVRECGAPAESVVHTIRHEALCLGAGPVAAWWELGHAKPVCGAHREASMSHNRDDWMTIARPLR